MFQEVIGKELLIDVQDGTSVKDLITRLLGGLEYRGITPVILVNNERIRLDYILKDGDIIDIAPPFSGG